MQRSPIRTAVCHLSSFATSKEPTHCICTLYLGSNCSTNELEKIISFELLKFTSDNSKCPIGKEKIALAILTNSRLRITVNWLQQIQQKYLHDSPIMLEWRCLQWPNIETEYKRRCENIFYPLCSHQTKISFLGMITKMLRFCNKTCSCWLS